MSKNTIAARISRVEQKIFRANPHLFDPEKREIYTTKIIKKLQFKMAGYRAQNQPIEEFICGTVLLNLYQKSNNTNTKIQKINNSISKKDQLDLLIRVETLMAEINLKFIQKSNQNITDFNKNTKPKNLSELEMIREESLEILENNAKPIGQKNIDALISDDYLYDTLSEVMVEVEGDNSEVTNFSNYDYDGQSVIKSKVGHSRDYIPIANSNYKNYDENQKRSRNSVLNSSYPRSDVTQTNQNFDRIMNLPTNLIKIDPEKENNNFSIFQASVDRQKQSLDKNNFHNFSNRSSNNYCYDGGYLLSEKTDGTEYERPEVTVEVEELVESWDDDDDGKKRMKMMKRARKKSMFSFLDVFCCRGRKNRKVLV